MTDKPITPATPVSVGSTQRIPVTELAEERGSRSRTGWFDAANVHGFNPTDQELSTGWIEWLSVRRAVILQSPDDTKYQNSLRRLLSADCERGVCVCLATQKRAGGVYMLCTDEDGQGYTHQTPERTETEYLVAAPVFLSWLFEQGLVPSSHVKAWDIAVGTPAPADNTATPAQVEELDYSLLATPDELLDAFGKWGMDGAWFDDLNSRQWLLDARRKKGQGQKGQVLKPLFCPFAVMNGLIGKVRKDKRLQADTAWRTLEHKFPRVYSTFESHDPRDRTGD